MINIRELYMMIETIPETGYEYLIHRLDGCNSLNTYDKRMLSIWITKGSRCDHPEIIQKILCALDPENIRWIANPTEELQFNIIYNFPQYIEYIEDQSESLQLAAINNNVGVKISLIFNRIRNPSDAVWIATIKDCPEQIIHMINPPISYQMAAIMEKPSLLSRRIDWHQDVYHAAFSLDKSLFYYITDPTDEECWLAIQFDANHIKMIENPTEEMKAFATIMS